MNRSSQTQTDQPSSASSSRPEKEKRYHLLCKLPGYEGPMSVGSMHFRERWIDGQHYVWSEYVRPHDWERLDAAGQFTWADKDEPTCYVHIIYDAPDTRPLLKRIWDFFS